MSYRRYNRSRSTSDPYNDAKQVHHEFPSWGAWIDYVEHGVITAPDHVCASTEKDTGSRLTRSFEHALEMAKAGWPEQCEKIQRVLAPLVNKLTCLVEKQQFYMDVYSPMGLYDMASVAHMVPEDAYNFATTYEDETGSKVVKIVVNFTASYDVTAESLTTRGLCIAGIVNALELSGIRAEIILCGAITPRSWSSYTHSHVYITIKRPSDDLDLALLAFQVSHPSVLRRLMLRYMEIHGNTDEAYGTPREVPKAKRGDLYFGMTHLSETPWYRYATAEGALEFIKEQLATQNIMLGN